jgi:SAM-dependent methyltransferase
LERHRLLWLYFQTHTNIFSEPIKLLHVAPELCFYHAFQKLEHLDYVTADINSPLASVRMDITHIQFADNTFDAIVCNHVLEHINDDGQAMRELYRVLKPGGWAVIQSPVEPGRVETLEDAALVTRKQRLQFYGHDDHRRLYGSDYVQRLESAGFDVTVDPYVKTLDAESRRRHVLNVNEDIYFCTKPLIWT